MYRRLGYTIDKCVDCCAWCIVLVNSVCLYVCCNPFVVVIHDVFSRHG